MNLSIEALDWSLRHHRRYGDTDLFPRAFEFEVIEARWSEFRKKLAAFDLTTHEWRAGRSLLFMKDQVSFRRATQFDPVDSILFGALIWTIAPDIEARRPPREKNSVFSYRFEASSTGQLFAPGKAKNAFWTHTVEACKDMRAWLLTTDITDFYNQIRHSTLKAELDATVTDEQSKALMSALAAVQGNDEVGIPVGPHSAHLLAELVLAPFDEHMLDLDPKFLRFVDDVHVACKSEDEAREVLYEIADYMHRNLQLSLSRHKTQVLNGQQLRAYARTALGLTESLVGDKLRGEVERIVEEHTSGPDDEDVDFFVLDDKTRESLSAENITEILDELLDGDVQIQLKKYLRGLTHLRAPGAVDWVVDNLPAMLPALPQAIEYLHSAMPSYEGSPFHVLDVLIKSLELPIVEKSEHMQTLLLAICVQCSRYVEFKKISPLYSKMLPAAQREIVLLAGKLGSRPWLKKLAATAETADPWLLRALVEASKCLIETERQALNVKAKRVVGSSWMLEDPAKQAENVLAGALLAPEVLLTASKLNVTLTLTATPRPQYFTDAYGGSLQSTGVNTITLSGVDLPRLLGDAKSGRLEGNGGAPDVLQIMLADGQCLFEKLPEVTVVSHAESDIDNKTLAKVLKQTDILIVTSAEIERRSVLARFNPLQNKSAILVGSHKSITYRCGQFGRYAAAHVHTTQGPDGRHGATLTVAQALDGMKFKVCLVIGIGFGFDRTTQRLGDVLIAEQVQPYEHAKVEGDGEVIKARGAIMSCGTVLSDRFRSRMDTWQQKRALTPVALQQGVVLSGAKLVNSKPFRDRLLNSFKELKPIGGEMEGHATYAAAQQSGVQIILVKAICDWADGEKDDAAQPFAMEMAVDACEHLLLKSDVLSSLKAKDLGLPAPKSKDLPDVSAVLAEPKQSALDPNDDEYEDGRTPFDDDEVD